jgi:Secretion system C-terminal sorting domain
MKKLLYLTKFLLVATFVFGSVNISKSQTPVTAIFQPGGGSSEDAIVDSYWTNTNSGAAAEIVAQAWTHSGASEISRSLIRFDLSSIPTNVFVTSAKLYLYNNPQSVNGLGNGQHSQLSGSNAAVINRVLSAWNESTVTWVTQPASDTVNQVFLPANSTPHQDYVVDITAMTASMVANPASNFGFILQEQIEIAYRCLLFASGDHPNDALHPKLEVTYIPCNGFTGKSDITAYGNPTFCAGSDVTLGLVNASTITSFQWQKNGVNISGATSKYYTTNTSGSYRCIVSNICGGDTSNTIVTTRLANAVNTVALTGSTSFCFGDSVMLNSTNTTPNYSYQWYRNNIAVYQATAISMAAKNPGSYKVVSKNNSNGCSRISSNAISVIVNCREAAYEAPTVIEIPARSIKLYPNPNTGSFTVEYNKSDLEDAETQVEVLNINGQTIFNQVEPLVNGSLKCNVDLNQKLPSGVYFVRIHLEEEVITQKMMIE